MKRHIHVNQHVIKRNTKTGEREPVITCKSYKENQYGHAVVIFGTNGEEACRVVYSPDKPLSCGARVYIETYNNVEVLTDSLAKKVEQQKLELIDDEQDTSGILS